MKSLAILGASGHGKVVADCAEMCGWTDIIFFDDTWPHTDFISGWIVEGTSSHLLERASEFDGVLVAIGNNAVRLDKLQSLRKAGAFLPVLVHPSAVVSRYVSIEGGTVVFAGAVINIDCSVGMGAIINTSASVDHDCILGDSVHISPGAHLAGGVSVGNLSWIGIGGSVRQLVRIGSEVIIGAGASVVADVSDGSTVVGVPARPLF